MTIALVGACGCASDSSLGSGRDLNEAVNAGNSNPQEPGARDAAAASEVVDIGGTADDVVPRDAGAGEGDRTPNVNPVAMVPDAVASADPDPISDGGGATSETSGAGGTTSVSAPEPDAGGTAGAPVGMPEATGGTPEPATPTASAGVYDPRNGSFTMLVYSKTAGFRHTDSIRAGQAMLSDIAT
jgi:hypothetical protein